MKPSLFFPDDRTLVLGPETLLREMMTATGDAGSPLLDRLRKLDPQSLAGAVMVVDSLREQIASALAQLPIPPPLQQFTDIPQLLTAVELHPAFSGQARGLRPTGPSDDCGHAPHLLVS